MIFWSAIAAMCAIAVASILVPALKQRDDQARDDYKADQLRRLEELEADVAEREVDADSAAGLRAELERSVLDGVTTGAVRPISRGGWRLPILAALAVPALALLLYLEIGRPEIASYLSAKPEARLSDPQVSVDFMLQQVRERLDDHPDDAQAWEILARSSLRLGQYDDALLAATRLAELVPNDPQVLLLLIDATAMQAGGAMVPAAQKLINRLLKIDPDNVNGLVLLGMAKMQNNDQAGAIEAWQRAVPRLPTDSPLRAELAGLLELPAPNSDAASEVDGVRTRVTVKVSIAADLAAEVAADTPVFVFARAANGPPAPLAAVRHSVGELPLAVELTEQMAMIPNNSLSDFDQVYVVARIALSGQPQAQAGDFEGRSAVFDPKATASIDLQIDQLVD